MHTMFLFIVFSPEKILFTSLNIKNLYNLGKKSLKNGFLLNN